MGNIPELSHKSKHDHSGVGFGYGAYDGEQGAAIGLTHHCDNTAFKFSAGASGGETVLGAGVTFSF